MFLIGRHIWFHDTEMINLFYQNLTFPLGVNSCLDFLEFRCFPGKIFFLVLYSLLDSKVIGKRYLKFLFDIRKLPYKVRIAKEANRQNSIYTSFQQTRRLKKAQIKTKPFFMSTYLLMIKTQRRSSI